MRRGEGLAKKGSRARFYSVAMDTDSYSRAEYLHYLQAETTDLARVKQVVQNAMKRSRLTMSRGTRSVGAVRDT